MTALVYQVDDMSGHARGAASSVDFGQLPRYSLSKAQIPAAARYGP